MDRRRRVVITGLGVVAPNGIGKNAFWRNLVAGKSAVDTISAFDPTPFPSKVAAEVRDFHPADFMRARDLKMMGRFTQFAVAAARLAIEDSGLRFDPSLARDTSVCFGNSVHGAGDVLETTYPNFLDQGLAGVPPWTCMEFTAHAPASHVAIEFGITGQAATLASACSTGLDVIQWGFNQIVSGAAEVVIAGTSDAPLFPLPFSTFCSIGVLSRWTGPPAQASRPYDQKRDGLVLSEGGACVVLEEAEHAIDRDATTYAEILASASASESQHMRKVDTSGKALLYAINTALSRAAVAPREIDYINAHGNGMPEYDIAETNAFKDAFANGIYSIPISSIKSMVGQGLAVSGTLQAISSCLSLQTSMLPPTINYQFPDPECDLDYVPNHARRARVRNILINSHGMGGTHSVAVLCSPS